MARRISRSFSCCRWLLPLFFLLAITPLQAQQPAEEAQLAAATSDTARLSLLRQLAIRYREQDSLSAYRYALQGLELARQQQMPLRQAAFYIVLANHDMAYSGYIRSRKYLDSAEAIFRKENDKKGIASVLSGKGAIAQRQSDLVGAIHYFLDAYEMSEKAADRKGMVLNSYNTAITYCDLSNGAKAVEYAQKTLQMVREDNNEKYLGMTLGVLAEGYRLSHDTLKANRYFDEAIQEYTRTGNEYGVAAALTNKALVTRDLQEQLAYQLRAQAYWDKAGVEDLMAVANLTNLGASYYELYKKDVTGGKYGNKASLLDQAAIFTQKSIDMAARFGNRIYQAEPLKTLALIQYDKGNYKAAYESIALSRDIADSVFSQENKNRIAALESREKISLRDKEIRIGRLKLETQRRQTIAVVIVAGLLVLIGLMLYRQSRARKRANADLLRLNAALEEANLLKARLFGMLSHDLRSPVARLVNFLKVQKESPELLDEASAAQHAGRIRASAEHLLETMESVLIWSKGQMEQFTPKPETIPVSGLFEDIRRHFDGIANLQLRFEHAGSLQLHSDPEFVKTIMRNLTDNAIKAVSHHANPLITWAAAREQGQVVLSITDNGQGATESQIKALYDDRTEVIARNGLGFHLVRDLARMTGCRIEVHTQPGEGTTFRLWFGDNAQGAGSYS